MIKRILSAVLLFAMLLSLFVGVVPAAEQAPLLSDASLAFTDVKTTDWYFTEVNSLYLSRVIGGFGDGTFRPKNTVTTGQALKMILLASGFEEPEPVESHWARGYLDLALEQQIIESGDITDLDVPMTRLLVAKVVARAIGAPEPENGYFSDTEDAYANALKECDIMGGYPDGTFLPNKSLTRAELSAIVYRIQLYMDPSKLLEEVEQEAADLTLRTSEKCISYIKKTEGFTRYAYWDYSQYSIGYGSRCLASDYPLGITEKDADTLLRKLLKEFETEFNKFLKNNHLIIEDNVYDALMSFTYNTGTDWFVKGSRLSALLIEEDYTENEIASALGIWCHLSENGSVVISDMLLQRRIEEIKMLLYGDYNGSNKTEFCTVKFYSDEEDSYVDVDIALYVKGSSYNPQFNAYGGTGETEFVGWLVRGGRNIWLDDLKEINHNYEVDAIWE